MGRNVRLLSSAASLGMLLILPQLAFAADAAGNPQSIESAKPHHHGLDVDGARAIDVLQDDLKDDDVAALGLTPAETARYKRNNLVGKYLQISDKLCGVYLQDLTRVQRNYSLIFGSLSTIFGAAGSAFTHASVVRPLSALAAISSGERAEIDADTFVKQTSQVIIAGIKNSRARTYNTMVQVNFLKSITDWPINVALADVQDYHSRCSLNEGITEAAASISAVAPQSTPQATNGQSGVAGRSESPPSLTAVAGSAAAGAAKAVSEGGGTPTAVANAAAGAAAGASTAAGGNPSTVAAGAAGAAVVPIVAPPGVAGGGTAILSTAADVARVQLALSQKAKASIVIDGAIGPTTIAALKAFQAAQSPPIPQTGVVDSATRLALSIKEPGPAHATSAPDTALIKRAQGILLKQMFSAPISSALKANGILDAPTIAAIVVFQNAHNESETGVLDDQTLGSLGLK